MPIARAGAALKREQIEHAAAQQRRVGAAGGKRGARASRRRRAIAGRANSSLPAKYCPAPQTQAQRVWRVERRRQRRLFSERDELRVQGGRRQHQHVVRSPGRGRRGAPAPRREQMQRVRGAASGEIAPRARSSRADTHSGSRASRATSAERGCAAPPRPRGDPREDGGERRVGLSSSSSTASASAARQRASWRASKWAESDCVQGTRRAPRSLRGVDRLALALGDRLDLLGGASELLIGEHRRALERQLAGELEP